MKFKVTYELDMELTGGPVKGLSSEGLAESLHNILDDWEDGRHNLARETLQALTQGTLRIAARSALVSVLHGRYMSRLNQPNRDISGYVSYRVADKRLASRSSISRVTAIMVRPEKESDMDKLERVAIEMETAAKIVRMLRDEVESDALSNKGLKSINAAIEMIEDEQWRND